MVATILKSYQLCTILLVFVASFTCMKEVFGFSSIRNNQPASLSRRTTAKELSDDNTINNSPPPPSSSIKGTTRRQAFQKSIITPLLFSIPSVLLNKPTKTYAAPPIAIIAEELGYFPITNRQGITQYVPAKVKRSSTEQSINLAKYLSSKGAIMYGTYWCGHTSHQKELFGKEAWDVIQYVECSPKGVYYDSERLTKVANNIDGFPTWYIPNNSGKGTLLGNMKGNGGGNSGGGEWISGEMPLERIAQLSGYKGNFDVQLEGSDISGAGSC